MALLGVYTDSVLSFSLLANVAIGGLYWLTGIGRKMILRIKQQWKHKKGGYVNTMFVSKNGTAEEIFKKMDASDKSLKIGDFKYTVDRKKSILFDGIPTQLHFEGITEPQNWNEPLGMSTGELQQIIENNKREGFLEMLKQYWPIVLTLVITTVALALFSAYLNWKIFDIVVQGGTGVITAR